VKIFEREGLRRRYRLAHRGNGACVFLTEQRRCRIHEVHGEEAKPLICRMFPFQLVPQENVSVLTLRRHCPSAAADRGRPLEAHLKEVRRLAEQRPKGTEPVAPPAITRHHRRPWRDVNAVTGSIERLMLDDRYPPVRRLAHSLQFCRLLQMCRSSTLAGRKMGQLLAMLETSAVAEASEIFGQRQPPRRGTAGVFRQVAFDYVRLHPKFTVENTWRQRVRLIRATWAYARGKGQVPPVHPEMPPATFAQLEEPLGHLGIDVLGPLNKYFEVAAASRHYAILGRRHWPLVESFRALALAFPVGMWMLRLVCGDRPPEVDDVIDVVAMIDRGQGFATLSGPRHRHRVRALTRLDGLTRLVAWYGR